MLEDLVHSAAAIVVRRVNGAPVVGSGAYKGGEETLYSHQHAVLARHQQRNVGPIAALPELTSKTDRGRKSARFSTNTEASANSNVGASTEPARDDNSEGNNNSDSGQSQGTTGTVLPRHLRKKGLPPLRKPGGED